MNSLLLKATEDTPSINFDAAKGWMEITGRSLPEDAMGFYKPIIDWITEYSRNPNKNTTFVFKFEYYNTASAKQLLKILWLLEELSKKNKVSIDWHYHPNDPDMFTNGERYSKLTTVKFNLIKD